MSRADPFFKNLLISQSTQRAQRQQLKQSFLGVLSVFARDMILKTTIVI
jgi:hypothetical protein